MKKKLTKVKGKITEENNGNEPPRFPPRMESID